VVAEPRPSLAKTWSPLDLGLHAFLVVNPLALGLWTFSLAPLVGGNLFIAVALAGIIVVLGAVVLGSLATRWPWTGGDYAWQTRLLDARFGAVLALTSWWLVVALLAPVYGNVALVQVIDPLLTYAEWNGLASWFRGRDGIFTSSLLAITIATAFAGLGMRRAAIAQRSSSSSVGRRSSSSSLSSSPAGRVSSETRSTTDPPKCTRPAPSRPLRSWRSGASMPA